MEGIHGCAEFYAQKEVYTYAVRELAALNSATRDMLHTYLSFFYRCLPSQKWIYTWNANQDCSRGEARVVPDI